MSLPARAPAASDSQSAPGPPRRTPDTYWLLEGVTNLFFDLMGGLYVRGEENVPASGPVLYVSNHRSYLDPPAIGDASPRRVVFMAKEELFRVKPLGFLLRGVDSFPVKRGQADRQAFKTTLQMLEEGRCVCIFPEGTRHTTEELGTPEPGAALFALKTGCTVVPVYVEGSDRVLDVHGKIHRGRVTVNFGLPFSFEKGRADREAMDAAGRRLMEEIARTRDAAAGKPARRLHLRFRNRPKEGSRAR